MLRTISYQFGEILGEVVETFRDLSSQTPVGRRRRPEGVWEDKSRKVSTATSPKFRRTAGKNRKARPRKKVTHFFILFFKNALLSLIYRLYQNEPDPSIYISRNWVQSLHIFAKSGEIWFFLQTINPNSCRTLDALGIQNLGRKWFLLLSTIAKNDIGFCF